MSFLRLTRNCGIFAKSLALNSCIASASIVSRFNGAPLADKNVRSFSLSALRYCQDTYEEGGDGAEPQQKTKSVRYDKPNRDRSNTVDVATSIDYMKSSAYYQTYGSGHVWDNYRRVHKGGFAPRKTRESCIRFKVVTTSSPCPICRDEYLVLDHRNLDLLKQFISPYTGQVEPYSRTGLCQKQHRNLLTALERAYDLGVITYEVPFRKYNYSDYYNFNASNATKE